MSKNHSAENSETEKHFATAHLLNNLKGRTVSSGVVTVTAQGIKFVLTLGSTVALARLLTPEDFGLVAMVMAVLGFLRVFKEAGLSSATVQGENITHAQVSNLFWINVGLSGALGIMVALSSPLIAWFYHEPHLVWITILLALTFPIEGATVQHVALLKRQMRFKAIAVIQIGSLIAGIAAGVGMALLKYRYWSLVGYQLAMPLVAGILSWWFSRWQPQFFTKGAGTRPLLNFGANLAASNLIFSLARGADSLLIGRYFGPDSVGLYSRAGALLNRPLEQFLSPVHTVFIPVLSRTHPEPERYKRTFLQIYEVIALVSFLFTGLFLALSRPIILFLLGASWEKAVVIFAGFTLAALFYPISDSCGWLFESQGRGRDSLVVSSIISVVTVFSVVIGLPYGPTGVALALSIGGLILQLPFVFYWAGRTGPVTTRDLWMGFLRHLPVWLVVCGVTLFVHTLVAQYTPLVQLLVCTPSGLLAGLLFIYFYPPSRKTATKLVDALQEFRRNRKATLI